MKESIASVISARVYPALRRVGIGSWVENEYANTYLDPRIAIHPDVRSYRPYLDGEVLVGD